MKKTLSFVDEAKMVVRGGSGGSGVTSFRRARFLPNGGPDGGNGGNGGSIYMVAGQMRNSLSDFRHCKLFYAEDGVAGSGSRLSGKCGKNLEIPVPVGTLVHDADTGELIGEITHEKSRLLVAKGGERGFGNAHFKSSINRTSKRSTKGKVGETRTLLLDFRLLADVVLTGMPNAGKSSLLAAISNARPKISAYPFTTLFPVRGVVHIDGWKSFVVTDFPGVISGAAQGKGLGSQFLKHLERARLLLHLCDISGADWSKALSKAWTFIHELRGFSTTACNKERWLVMTKCDLLDEKAIRRNAANMLRGLRWQGRHFCISTHDTPGLETLKRAMLTFIEKDTEVAGQ